MMAMLLISVHVQAAQITRGAQHVLHPNSCQRPVHQRGAFGTDAPSSQWRLIPGSLVAVGVGPASLREDIDICPDPEGGL